MIKKSHLILLSIFLTSFSTIRAQDTLVGWTFPEGSTNAKADLGNDLNKNGMFVQADSINEIPFTPSISFAFDGYLTKSASTNLWDHAKDLKCWKFTCDATGYRLLHIFARVSSDSLNPGPRDFKIQYRLGCCAPEWHDVPDAAPFKVAADWTTGWVNNVAIPADADSMSGFEVRFVCISDTATDGTILKTTSRSLIDEVYVTGTKMTSINDRTFDPGLQLFPNPASDQFQLIAVRPIKEYQLYDITGKIIKSGMINSARYHINTSDLKQGCYLIDLQFENNYHAKKKLIIK